jgi:hypothetical protein
VTCPRSIRPTSRLWSDEQWAVIHRGHRSTDSDDRWHAFVRDDRLFLHRSWTGNGIFEAQFCRTSDGWTITELVVCRDPERYRGGDDAYEATVAESLVDQILLADQGDTGSGPFGG